ncbi:MAG: hypothetical protein PHW89_04965 [Sulfurimonas denitrificans]|nr:hypothetical protein [Sulfurimonas denitrificans]
MLKIYECLSAESEIVALKALDNSLVAYCTKNHGVKIFDINRCDLKKSITNAYLNSTAGAYAFSPNSRYFSFSVSSLLYIIDTETKSIVQSIQTNDGEIEIISFDPSSTYIIVGTKNGRVLQYKTNQSNILSRLCSFPYKREESDSKTKEFTNFVSAFAFYKNQFACSGYGGTIYIIDINTQTNKEIITHNKSRLNALCFLDENRVVCGSSDGTITIFFLNDINNYKIIRTALSGISQLLIMSNPNYLMVVSSSKIIMVVDTKNYKITHTKYIEFKAQINSVDIVNDSSLIAALANNTIVNVELRGVTKLKTFILHNSLEKAFELIAKEPMLHGLNEHKILEERFEKSYENATKALISQNVVLASQILDVYKNVKQKEQKIKELFDAFKNYLRFKVLFLEKKLPLAYAMCARFEPLKNTPQYQKMEQEFQITFLNAQRYILKNSVKEAKELLSKYNSVLSKKPLINLLLTQNKEFVAFLKAIQTKDFSTINQLVKMNKLFKEIPNYIAMYSEIDKMLEHAEIAIKKGEIEDAEKLLLVLKGVDKFEDRLEELHKKCRYVQILQKAYEESNFLECYEILDMHKYLKTVELGILLEKHWLKLIKKCEEYALEGNIRDIKKSLAELITLHSRRHKIGDLLRVSFHVRVQKLLQRRDFKGSEAIIYSYIDFFGIDSEMKNLMKSFEKISERKLAISEVQMQRPRRDSWRDFDIFMKDS